MLTGYRTLIVAFLVTLVGALQGLNLIDLIPNNPRLVGLIGTGLGIVMFILRALTTTPIGGEK